VRHGEGNDEFGQVVPEWGQGEVINVHCDDDGRIKSHDCN